MEFACSPLKGYLCKLVRIRKKKGLTRRERPPQKLSPPLIFATYKYKRSALGRIHSLCTSSSPRPYFFTHTTFFSQPHEKDLASVYTSTSSLSHCSLHTSLNHDLSQCSSLTSLPSLGLSLNGSDSLYGDGRLLVDCACVAILVNHGDQVACSASPGEHYYYTASSSPVALPMRAWPHHGEQHQTYCPGAAATATSFGPKRQGAVRAMLVAGDRVYSSHDDLKIRVWTRPDRGNKVSGAGGRELHRIMATLPSTWDCMAKSVVASGYVQVRRHCKKLWIQHADTISALALDVKEGYLYSASWDRCVKVWRLRDFKCVESFRAHDDAINALAFSSIEGFLYTASADGKIKAWARSNHSQNKQKRRQGSAHRRHSLVATLEAHRSAVNALALSPDGALLYSGAGDKAIVVWEREESAQHASVAGALRGHQQAVLSLSAWEHTLCSGSADKTIRIWQRLGGGGRIHACVAVLKGHVAPVKSLSQSLAWGRTRQDGQRREDGPDTDRDKHLVVFLYSASVDNHIRVWKLS